MAVHAGSDGKVRSADVDYKIAGENKFQVTTGPIHKLMLVVPVEEQTMDEGEFEEEVEDEEEADPRNKGKPREI